MPFDQPHAPYDRKGKCKHHPQIRLRKRGTLGIGWTTLRLRCPLCFFGTTTLPAVDAAKTKKTAARGNVIPKSPTQDLERSDTSTSASPTVSSSSQTLFSASDHGTTATTLVAAAYPEDESSSVECGMPYSYTYHNITYPGFYTGQIRGGQPHGVGTWRGWRNASIIVKGEWFHGYQVEEIDGFHLKSAPSWNEDGFGIIAGQSNTRSNHKTCQKLVRRDTSPSTASSQMPEEKADRKHSLSPKKVVWKIMSLPRLLEEEEGCESDQRPLSKSSASKTGKIV